MAQGFIVIAAARAVQVQIPQGAYLPLEDTPVIGTHTGSGLLLIAVLGDRA